MSCGGIIAVHAAVVDGVFRTLPHTDPNLNGLVTCVPAFTTPDLDATAFLSGEDTGHWQNNPLVYECYLFKAPCFLFPFQAARQSEFLEMKIRAQSAKICGPPPINLEILLEMFNLRGQDLYCGSDHHLQKRT